MKKAKQMNRAIITGATGFIGSWLALELLSREYELVLIVRDKNKLIADLKDNEHVTVVEKAINDISSDDIEGTIDCLYHFAWEGVAPEKKNDISLQFKNIQMSIDVMELANRIGCRRFVSAGTVAEYTKNEAIDASKKSSPMDFYGATKTAVYYYLNVRALQLNIEFIWVIVPSTFGPRRFGNNILTYTIKELLANRVPQYGLLDQEWDFMYISDAVRAIAEIGERGKDRAIYGIGTGIHKPLREYILEVASIMNTDIEILFGQRQESSSSKVMSSYVDVTVLFDEIGFRPRVSFEEGIKLTIEYLKDEGNL